MVQVEIVISNTHNGRCALQYVTGLAADESANLAIISFGQVVVAAL